MGGREVQGFPGGQGFFERKDWEITDMRTCDDHLLEDYLRDMRAGKPAGRP